MIGLRAPGGNADDAGPFADGLGGIEHEVHDDLPELGGVGAHGGEILREVKVERHALANRAGQKVRGVLHELTEVEVVDDEPALARVGQHLFAQPRGALRSFLDLLEAREQRRAFGQVEERERGVADDAGEEVVEIVRDATGEDAETFELLRFLQLGLHALPLLLGLFARGDAHRGAGHARGVACGVGKGAAFRSDPVDGAVGPNGAKLDVIRGLRGERVGDRSVGGAAVIGMERAEKAPVVHRLVRRDAEDRLAAVRPGEFAGGDVPVPRAHLRGFEGDGQRFRTATLRLLRALAGGTLVRVIEGAADGERESFEAVFEDVIRGPAFHQLDGELLADRPRDKDHRQPRSQRVRDRQRGVAAKAGHVVIHERHAGPNLRQRHAQRAFGLDALRGNLEPAAAQCALNEFGVGRRIFEDEDAQGSGHNLQRERAKPEATPNPMNHDESFIFTWGQHPTFMAKKPATFRSESPLRRPIASPGFHLGKILVNKAK